MDKMHEWWPACTKNYNRCKSPAIQAYWRAKHALGMLRAELRSLWQSTFGELGERVTP